jgi:hypothetical protein
VTTHIGLLLHSRDVCCNYCPAPNIGHNHLFPLSSPRPPLLLVFLITYEQYGVFLGQGMEKWKKRKMYVRREQRHVMFFYLASMRSARGIHCIVRNISNIHCMHLCSKRSSIYPYNQREEKAKMEANQLTRNFELTHKNRIVVRIDGCTNQTTQRRKTEYPQPSKRHIAMNSGVRVMIFFAPCGLLHHLRWLESSARKAQAFSSRKLTLLWEDTVMVLWRTKFVKWSHIIVVIRV